MTPVMQTCPMKIIVAGKRAFLESQLLVNRNKNPAWKNQTVSKDFYTAL